MPPQVCTYEGKRERGGRLNVPRVNNGRAGAAAAAAAAASSSFARSFVRFAQFMFFSVKTQNRFHFASKPTGARVAATASPRPRRRRRWPRPRNRLTATVRSLARSFVRSFVPLHLRVQLSITHLTYCTSGRGGPQNTGTVSVSVFRKVRV